MTEFSKNIITKKLYSIILKKVIIVQTLKIISQSLIQTLLPTTLIQTRSDSSSMPNGKNLSIYQNEYILLLASRSNSSVNTPKTT